MGKEFGQILLKIRYTDNQQYIKIAQYHKAENIPNLMKDISINIKEAQ